MLHLTREVAKALLADWAIGWDSAKTAENIALLGNGVVPIKDEQYPYVVKATMVYSPKTSRNQGVDYTNTELNVKFGPLNTKGIQSINKDRQYDDSGGYAKLPI